MNDKNNISIPLDGIVPTSLIPLDNVTTKYSMKTYAYATLFDNVRFTYVTYNRKNDLIDAWSSVSNIFPN